MSNNVIVNLNVTQDASGNVSIFSQAAPIITDKVVVSKTLSLKNTLYFEDAADKSLFEFQGQGDDIVGRLNTTFATEAKTALTNGLTASLCGVTTSLDASGAAVFSTHASGSVESYYKMANLGTLALAYYAHHLFGHVQATAAIDNDTAIITRFNTTAAAGGAGVPDGLAEKITTLSAEAVTAIVKQVLGQDSTRAKNVDNDLAAPDAFQNLEWRVGDKIYVTVNIQRPNITIVDDTTQLGDEAGLTGASAGRVPTAQAYMMELTLSA